MKEKYLLWIGVCCLVGLALAGFGVMHSIYSDMQDLCTETNNKWQAEMQNVQERNAIIEKKDEQIRYLYQYIDELEAQLPK